MQTIQLDLSKKEITPILYAKQADVGRKFKAVLTDGGMAYPVPAGAAVSIWYSGSSGEGNYTDIGAESAVSVSGNEIVVEMIAQMLANYGVGTVCIVIHTAVGKQLGTWNIPYMVEPLPGMGSAAAQAYFTAFSKAVENLAYPDASLSAAGKAADAAAVGTALAGKAPAGYGLGSGGVRFDVNNIDNMKLNGWFYTTTPNGYYIGTVPIFYLYMRVDSWQDADGRYIVSQTIYYDYSLIQRVAINDVWGEWEWFNPPMTPGVEYRTTERWNGKAVYTRIIETGALTNGASCSLVGGYTMTGLVRCIVTNGSYMSPYYSADGIGGQWSFWHDIHDNNITAYMGSGHTSISFKVQIWYTKD